MKKKSLYLLVIIVAAILLLMLGTTKVNADGIMYGDVDGNGIIQNQDVSKLTQYLEGIIQLDENALIRADVNGNGRVGYTDAELITKYLAGKLPANTLPDNQVTNFNIYTDYEYTVDVENNSVTVHRYKGTATNVNIPKMIDDIPVKILEEKDNDSFFIQDGEERVGVTLMPYNSTIKKVVLPDTITKIGWGVFSNCRGLEDINLSKNLKEIDSWVFENCISLKSIIIPESVETIGYGAFENCSNLETIRFLGFEKIQLCENEGEMTFIGCNKLTLELLKETKNLENYAKKYNIPYHIYASHIGKLTPDFTFENRIYTGSEITATSIEIIDDNYTLVEGTDFNVEYSNNINAGTATITIKGIGNYAGTKTATFEILPKNLSEIEFRCQSLSKVYDNSNWSPNIELYDANYKLVLNKDWTGKIYSIKDVGTSTEEFTGIGNYTGTVVKEFEITPKDISGVKIVYNNKDQVYTGNLLTTTISYFKDQVLDINLQEGKDYEIVYTNNVNVGTATLTINGIGNYSGSIEKHFNITPKNIILMGGISSSGYTYSGNEIKPKISGLVEGKDYNISYENNINAGTATATVVGIGNYEGSRTYEFTIDRVILYKDMAYGTTQSMYTGKDTNLEKLITIMYNGKKLKYNVDYTISGLNNNIPGTYNLSVTGKGNFYSSFSWQYKITNASISNARVVLLKDTYEYTGNLIFPEIELYFNDNKLEKGKEWKFGGQTNAINAGNAFVTIRGEGYFGGDDRCEVYFKITPKKLSDITVSADTSNRVYTGNAIKIPITLKNGNTNLIEGTDYIVTYNNNINPGVATVTIEGKGNYTGTTEKTFAIYKKEEPQVIVISNPDKVNFTSVKNIATKSAKLTWKKDSNVDGYEIYMAEVKKDSKKMKTKSELTLRKSTSTKSKALVNIPKGALVQIIKKNVKKSGGYTWYKVKYNGKTGYVASKYLKDYYKTSSYKKVKTITNKNTTTHTQKKLTKNKKYSFKIRAYKNASGKTYYGDYSNIKEVTIKK